MQAESGLFGGFRGMQMMNYLLDTVNLGYLVDIQEEMSNKQIRLQSALECWADQILEPLAYGWHIVVMPEILIYYLTSPSLKSVDIFMGFLK